jgi:LacI family transcriptional regulator
MGDRKVSRPENGKRGSIRDVAARAKVSPATVSNVLNHLDVVAPSTRLRVEKAIKELNFVRNESARQLRAGRSRTIGLVVLDVGNPFFTDVARGVEEFAAERDTTVLLCSSSGSTEREAQQLTLLAEQRVRGVLIVPNRFSVTQLRTLRNSDTPVVLLDHRSPNRQICSVSVDDEMGGNLAVAHLLSSGHRRIAFIGGEGRANQVHDRANGGRRAIDEAGHLSSSLTMIDVESLNVAGGREAGRQLLAMSKRTRPTAAFCANDLLALGLLQEFTLAGVNVPDDLAIVGYDDIEYAAAAAVPLTSVRQPSHEVGVQATSLLFEELEDEGHRHQQVVFEPELVIRRSSGSAVGAPNNKKKVVA